ncbi:30S ribosome-binding factor RbfA [Eisenibacter elegans]|jgi:ribosome-binding factor A|uniref:30S ribosome-binding factor RbfA n=1 Tax=Eisenibacter elegans TaxID=997 RepID=UPI00041BECFB|nr:30S ribosome-binding factor RbfA [Eisenibacter elegans]
MESQRQQKMARLLQRELGEVFQRDAVHLFNQQFITITGVRITPDFGQARVYLSFLMDKNKDQALEDVQAQTKTLRQYLAQRIKNQVRIIPELQFFLDDTQEYAARIDELLSKLDIPPADEDKH